MIMANGQEYDGTWQEGIPNGPGREVSAAGDVFEGEFVMGKKHGQGKLVKKSGVTYEGAWDAGVPHGPGIEQHVNGPRFEGTYNRGA